MVWPFRSTGDPGWWPGNRREAETVIHAFRSVGKERLGGRRVFLTAYSKRNPGLDRWWRELDEIFRRTKR